MDTKQIQLTLESLKNSKIQQMYFNRIDKIYYKGYTIEVV